MIKKFFIESINKVLKKKYDFKNKISMIMLETTGWRQFFTQKFT